MIPIIEWSFPQQALRPHWCLLLALLWISAHVEAVDLTWDATPGGAVNDGAGTWLTANQWNNGAPNATWSNANPDNALIGNGGTGGTITLGAVTAGTVTFNAFSGTYTLSGGSLAMGGAMTVNTGAGTIAISTPISTTGSMVVTRNNTNNLTWSGGYAGAGDLTVRGGAGALQLTGSTTGVANLIIGDGTTFSGNGVGGNVSVNSQSSLGSGAVTINYGGSLDWSTVNFSPTNNFTVNSGGYLKTRGAPSGSFTFANGSSISSFAGCTLPAGLVTLPSAGFFLNAGTSGIALNNPWPALTGTMAFGGYSTSNLSSAASNLSSSAGTARTIAINQTGGGAFVFNGVTLNADLIVAGSGNGGLSGLVPNNAPAGNLGTITQDANRDITVAMGATGLVQVTPSAGWRHTLLIRGTLQMQNLNGAVGAGTVTLDGGSIRAYQTNNASSYSTASPMAFIY